MRIQSPEGLRILESWILEGTSRPIRLSTACSGSGTAELAHMQIMQYRGHKAAVDFSCESDTSKQQYLIKLIHPMTFSFDRCSPCCFDDVAQLGRGAAHCCMHSGQCDVPTASDIFIAGFSCKDFSSLSQKVTSYSLRSYTALLFH